MKMVFTSFLLPVLNRSDIDFFLHTFLSKCKTLSKVISEYQPSSLEKVYICDYGKDAQEKIAQYKLAFEKYLNK